MVRVSPTFPLTRFQLPPGTASLELVQDRGGDPEEKPRVWPITGKVAAGTVRPDQAPCRDVLDVKALGDLGHREPFPRPLGVGHVRASRSTLRQTSTSRR